MEGCIIAGNTVRGMLAASVAIAAFDDPVGDLALGWPRRRSNQCVHLRDSAMRPVKIMPQALQLWRVAMWRAADVKPPALGPRTGWEW